MWRAYASVPVSRKAVTVPFRYHSASETSLYGCYHSIMLRAMEGSAVTLAIPCLNQERKGFPRELAAHIALRTIRRFFEAHPAAPAVILAIESAADVVVYDSLLPLYFPRSDEEARAGSVRLPQDLGDPVTGAPHFPDREVRVSALPCGGCAIRSDAAKEVLGDDGTGLNLNRMSFKSDFDAPFTAMRSDLTAASRADDPTVAAALAEGKYVATMTYHLHSCISAAASPLSLSEGRYVKLLIQSKSADLSVLEKMGFFRCGQCNISCQAASAFTFELQQHRSGRS